MQIQTMNAEMSSPEILAEKERNDTTSCWQRFRKLALLDTPVMNINSSLTI